MNIRWHWHRLTKMSLSEIGMRLRESLYKFVDSRRARSPSKNTQAFFKEKISPQLLPLPTGDEFARIFPEEFKRVTQADMQCDSISLNLFSLKNLSVSESLNWHKDYSSGTIVPRIVSWKIDRRNPALVGNIKYIWELNRLQHLIPAARNYYLTKHPNLLNYLKSQIMDWQESNPYLLGINWTSALEAAIRLISFFWILNFCRDNIFEDEFFTQRYRVLLYEHCRFIRRYSSFGSSANNHLIGEMSGLFLICRFFPFFPKAGKWGRWAKKKLEKEIIKQIHSDGVTREQAIHYQCFNLDFFVLAGLVGNQTVDEFSEAYWTAIQKQVQFLKDVSNPAGNYPVFGDSDSGHAWVLDENREDPLPSFMDLDISTTSPHLLTRRDNSKWFWLGAVRSPCFEKNGDTLRVSHYPEGGFIIISNGKTALYPSFHFVFFANPIGMLPLMAHGHADALSFYLSIDNREIFVDPGTFCYHVMPEWRDYFRSSIAHNTILPESQEPIQWVGPFLGLGGYKTIYKNKLSTSRLINFEAVRKNQKNGNRLIREVWCFPEESAFHIQDRFHPSTGPSWIYFHLSEQCTVQNVTLNIVEIVNHVYAYLVIHGDQNIESFYGSENPILGWRSKSFDEKVPSFTLRASADAQTQTSVILSARPLSEMQIIQRYKTIGTKVGINF